MKKTIKKFNIIDLFSGSGGLTEGFRNKDFNILTHVEKDNDASKTLRLRDSFYYLSKNNKLNIYYDFLNQKIDLNQLFEHIPEKIFKKTINKEINYKNIEEIFSEINTNEEVDGIIGGPPCQAYSTIGRSRNFSKKETDERIYLYRYYIDFLTKYNPKFFVFENVKGLLSFKDVDDELLFPKMKKEFLKVGYELDYQIVNTKDYGIAQKRERVIIFGVPKNNKKIIPIFFNNLNNLKEEEVTFKDIIEDLPTLNSGQEINKYKNKPSSFIKNNFRKNDDIPLTQNISRPNNPNDLNIYKEVVKAKEKNINLKYNQLNKSLITHKHTDKFLDRYKSIDLNSQSHTVVAHISKDGHHYIHPDIKQNRSITVRESARIQGFPDDYYFLNSRTSAFKQIGNAVPPLLSKKISYAIKKIPSLL